MLFKILKLFGLDVRAEIAAVKGQIEERVEELAARAKQTALTSAVIVALSTLASLFCTMAIGVGLVALYRAEAAAYGVDVALAIIAALLVAAALILLGVAWMMGRSLSRPSMTAEGRATSAAAASASAAAAPAAQVPPPQATASPAPASAGDLTGPLTLLLGLFAKDPKLGHPVLDEFVGNLQTPAGGQPNEAVEQALNLVRNGDRTQLLTILGAAALVGWLLARSGPNPAPRDAAPTD